MITKNITQQPKSEVLIQVTMPWEDVLPKWNEVLQKLSQDTEIPGFRKGQAPLEMVEQKLGSNLQQEVLKVVMPQALMEALAGTDIVPIDYPRYQVTSFQKGAPLQFNAQITQRPKIQIGEYKTIKTQRPPLKPVTDEEVEKIVTDLYNRWKLRNPSSPPGASPQAQQPAQAAGGSLSFNNSSQPNIQAVNSQAQNPANSAGPDDVFAKAVGAESLADLRQKIRQDLENEVKYNNELDYEEAILQQVEKITQVDLPDVLIQDELNRMLLSLQRSVSERGLLLDEYLKGQNKTVEQIKNEWRPQAEKNVRMELGLSEIARQENVNISDEELQAEIDKVQDQRVKAQFNQEEPRMHLRHALRQTKTLNLLKTLVG